MALKAKATAGSSFWRVAVTSDLPPARRAALQTNRKDSILFVYAFQCQI